MANRKVEITPQSVYRFVMNNKWKVDSDNQTSSLLFPSTTVTSPNATDKSSQKSSSSSNMRHNSGEDEEDDDCDEGVDLSGIKEIGQYCFEQLDEHCIQERQGQKLFRCDICDGKYRHAFSLKRHFIRTHINYIYLSSSDISNCSINLSWDDKQARQIYFQSCSDCSENGQPLPPKTGLYRCNTCTERFNELNELKHHIANHPDNQSMKRFACTQCNMTFSHKQNLVRHLSVHSGEKPFNCKVCGKGFPTATNQRRHERIHEGLKPYVCPHCMSNFSQSGDLKKHIRKLHSEYFHPCAFCLKYFSTVQGLGEHCMSHGKTLDLNSRALKKKFNSAASSNALTINFAPDVPSSPPPDSFKTVSSNLALICPWCSKRFPTKMITNRHKKSCDARPRLEDLDENDDFEDNVTKEIVGVKSMTDKRFKSSKYYSQVSENIFNNLQNYVDGKLLSFNTKMQQKLLHDTAECVPNDTDWRIYNFPPDFTGVVAAAVSEINGNCQVYDDSNGESNHDNHMSSTVEKELSASGEDQVLDLSSNNIKSSNSIDVKCDANNFNDKVTSSVMIYICHACGERFLSVNDIDEHKINNHPNVYCTHLEIESSKGAPAEMFRFHCSPDGILQKCQVLPLIESEQVRCTKCQNSFAGTVELHEHILDCGSMNDEDTNKRKRHYWRQFKRGIKRDSSFTTPKLKRNCTRSKEYATSSLFEIEQNDELNCQFCGMKFKNTSALERHKKLCSKSGMANRTHVNSSHKCKHCGKHFSCAASLKKHSNDLCSALAVKKKQNLRKSRLKKKVLAVKIMQDKKIRLRHQVSLINDKVLQKLSAPKTENKVVSQEITEEAKLDPVEEICEKMEVHPPEQQQNDQEDVEKADEHNNIVDKEEKSISPNEEVITTNIEEEIKNELANNVELEEQQPVSMEEVPDEEEAPIPAPADVSKEISDETIISEIIASTVSVAEKEAEKSQEKPDDTESLEMISDKIELVENIEATVAPIEYDAKETKDTTVVVKTENDIIFNREQQHTCPNCKRTFTYLANFKKHLNHLCPLREVKKDIVGEQTSPVKPENVDTNDNTGDENDKINHGVSEGNNNTGSSTATRSRSSPPTCTICNKVFSCYVVMLKHTLSHKLEIMRQPENDGQSEINDDTEVAAEDVKEQEQEQEEKSEEDEEKEQKVEVSRTRSRSSGGRKRRKRTVTVAKRLKGARRIMPSRKSAAKVVIKEEPSEDEENQEESEDNDEDEATLNGSRDTEEAEDYDEEDENEVAVVLMNTRSKTNAMKKALVSDRKVTRKSSD